MVKKRLEEIRAIRLEKVKKLRKMGVDPYPSKLPEVTIAISKAVKQEGKEVSVRGRIWAIREHGNCCFFDIKDETGKIQLLFQKKNIGKNEELQRLLDIGDFIWVKGKVFKTEAGEITVDVEDFSLLTKSVRPLPSTWHGLKDVEERYRRRYVDLLLNDEVREVFETRAKIVKLLRAYFDERGFIEVKTPALQPVYGGATAKPFITHHNALDVDMYLRIADELYLKRLIVGGFEKVYEICTDFRNEGMDRWHNPEFSQLEFYWAYANYNDLMELTQDMLSGIVKEIKGSYKIKYAGNEINFKPPWKRVVFRDAIYERTKIDIDKYKDTKELLTVIKSKGVDIDTKDINDLPTVYDCLYKQVVRPSIKDPTFVIDHPYSMRPLAKRKEDNPDRVESLQPIAAGTELLNAYTELNDPQDQKARWEEDMKRGKAGAEEFQVIDKDFICALEYGMPPTAGWGMGIDRFTAILTNQHSIKDVILFPTLKPKDETRNRSK